MKIATKDQLIEATGYKQKSKQIEWLRARCKPFDINRFGNPVITEENLLHQYSSPAKPTKLEKKWQSKITV